MTKAVAKKEETALAELDLGAYAGAGMENVGIDDVQIPMLKITQALSPQLKRNKPEYVEGIQEGDLFLTVFNRFWPSDKGVTIIPVAYQRNIIEWTPREQGGGFVAMHALSDMPRLQKSTNDKGRPISETGTELIDTAANYFLVQTDDGWEPCFMPFSSSGHKDARTLNTLLVQQKLPDGSPAPRFLYRWQLTTSIRTKNEDSWYGADFERLGYIDKAQFEVAKSLYDQVKAGNVEIVDAETGEVHEAPFYDLPMTCLPVTRRETWPALRRWPF